ncbi:hypothetical protein VP1G_07747 [Cytospora mali]|uniref:Uncharacterized protein n=1 Tax=Cytospora mali TaxID=578113 RepID=A0A194V9J9_CYTMA|nr:hypothetical protein VP1G_07747 [Valsa mali var. pyri (nom. inval.)]
MSSMPTSAMVRASCSACPGGENVSPVSNMSKSSCPGSMTPSPGGRPVGAVRAIRGTTKGRGDLETTTNSIPTSAASSPVSATKQKWFASLRSRASHIPMPTSSMTTTPTRMMHNSTVPTNTISRLFRTPPHGKKESPVPISKGDVSPTVMARFSSQDQEALQAPLPKLVLPSFDPLSDVEMRYDKEAPQKDVQAHTAGETRPPGLKAARYSVKCDVYYPSIPWESARTDYFENATAALSNYCLNILLNENGMYSNVILWTSYTPRAEPSRRQQRFTVLPSYLKPDRDALGRNDEKYDWAIIAFRDGPVRSRIPAVFRGQHGTLQSALARVMAMGYYVDVWDRFDNLRWKTTMDDARTRGNEWLCVDQSCREKYDAMVRYGIAGFSAGEIGIVDEALGRMRMKQSKLENSAGDSALTGQGCQIEAKDPDDNSHGSDPESELNGFLEHQEESIAPPSSDNQFEFSGLSDDLDMASRLGGETFQ